MPELPEVETTKRGIEPFIKDQQIVKVEVYEHRLRWTIPDELDVNASLQTIVQVKRRAKYLILQLNSGAIIVHLGMSGNLRMVSEDTPVKKHDHVDILLSNNLRLRYHDPRRFGCILWAAEPVAEYSLFKKLGPEPLTDDFTGHYLYQISRHRTLPVKQLIMDNHVVVGVGNIYANESLFNAGINPNKPANKVSKAKYMQLVQSIKLILAQAIEQGGTTLKDFVGGDGKAGYFQQTLSVYGRGGLPCKHCVTLLKEGRLGQRSTVWCPKCQR